MLPAELAGAVVSSELGSSSWKCITSPNWFQKSKASRFSLLLWVFPVFNLGSSILNDPKPCWLLDKPVESRELIILRQWNRRRFPCLFCKASAVAAVDQGLAPKLVSAGLDFNEMPSNYIRWGSGPQCLIIPLAGTESCLAMQEQNLLLLLLKQCDWPLEGSHLLWSLSGVVILRIATTLWRCW